MNWFRKLFDRGRNEYRTADFDVRIEPIFRETVSVIYTRHKTKLNFVGEYIGAKWQGIDVQIPEEISGERAAEIAADLTSAFRAMKYGYIIARKVGVEIVPEAEREAAIAELREMGYEIDFLPDGKIRQTKRDGAPRHDIETLRKMAPRMMALIRSLHGKRQRFEILAKSDEF